MTDVGANLAFAVPWGSEYPFIDRMKTSSPDWEVHSLSYQYMNGDPSLIKDGYYTRLPDGAGEVGVAIGLDPPSLSSTDHYVITWSGTGTFRETGATVLSTGDHTMTINFTGTSGSSTYDQLLLYLTSIDPADPVHDIHVVREDQVSLFNQGEIFSPDFIDKLSGLDDLRFMDWGASNTTNVVSWADHTQESDRTWFSEGTSAGVPIEVMVKLCNETHADMWYNMPAEANDDYVQHALQYIHDNLDPSLTLHVEYSNEVWNWSFPQAHNALTQGDNLFGTDANHDGVINPDDPAEHVGDGWLQYSGYRAAQIATIANTIWTPDEQNRLEMVISSQTGNPATAASVFAGVEKELHGTSSNVPASAADISSLFHDYAITGYFGGQLGGAGSDPVKAAQVVAWAQQGAAGLDAAFEQIEHGGSVVDRLYSVDGANDLYQTQAAIAQAAGLNLVVYEGGPDLDPSSYNSSVQPLIASFFAELKADPRMAALISENVDNFHAAGGTLFNAYNDTGGPYGTLNTIYDPDNANWDAYKDAAAGGGGLHLTALAAGGLLTGGSGLDWLVGGAGVDHLRGMSGADILIGAAGDDILEGGTGADQMTGGLGNDTYYVDNAGDKVFEQAGEGTDLVWSAISTYTLGANVENLSFTGTMDHTGTGNELANTIRATSADDTLYGAGGNDTLMGMAGDDVLDGGQGGDTMYGATGNDTYYVDDARDKVIEHGNQGTDLVITALAGYTLAANVENLTFTGATDHAGTGNSLANVITAAGGDDVLNGGGGSDTLVGMAGDDMLDGGTGADQMSGGAGDDTYRVDNSHDAVIERANEGIDTVIASIATYALTDDVENLSFTGARGHTGIGNDLDNIIRAASGNDTLSGGGGDDTIMGLAGNDVLDGGTGADRLYGATGNDTYYVDNTHDAVIEHAGQGTDRVFASVSYTLAANVENLTLTGTANLYGHGNDLANTIVGNDGDNRLLGYDGNDVLDGGAGKDWFDGGNGDDTIIAGTGQDLIRGGAGADTFVFASGDGDTSATADRLKDFSHSQGDKIDLSAFAPLIGGDHDFHFIGAAGFSGEAGEVQVSKAGSSFLVGLDVDGDRHADFMLMVSAAGHIAPVQTDFVL